MHYAPRTPTFRVDSPGQLTAISWPERPRIVLGQSELPELPSTIQFLNLLDPETAGQRLYAVLHQCDALGLDMIVIVMPPDEPEWLTIRDRLVRAAQPASR